MMKKIGAVFFCVFCAKFISAQIPSTEIYLIDFDNHGSHSHVGKPVNISNSKGYDSQPCFSKDGASILFTSIRNGTQADIFEYEIVKAQTLQLTLTAESEYSPTYINDGKSFSTVRVEKDSAQRLWQFDFQQIENPKRILDKAIDSVGYHCWYSQGKLALFILTEPISLQLAEVSNWATITVIQKPGRCMQKVPLEEAFYFVDKSDSTAFYICKYANGSIEKLYETIKGSEDFCLTPEGNFIMAKDGALFMLTPLTKKWVQLADFNNEAITGITRVAISPDGKRIAIVAKEAQ